MWSHWANQLPWGVWMVNVLIVVVVTLLVVLGLQLRSNLNQMRRVVLYLPSIIISAVINAFGEEYEFRCVHLARLLPFLESSSLYSSPLPCSVCCTSLEIPVQFLEF